MLTIFQIPAGFATISLSYISAVFSDAAVLIAIAIGLPLAFWVIRRIQGLMPKKLEKKEPSWGEKRQWELIKKRQKRPFDWHKP